MRQGNSECGIGNAERLSLPRADLRHSAFPVPALPSLVLILYAVAAGVESALGGGGRIRVACFFRVGFRARARKRRVAIEYEYEYEHPKPGYFPRPGAM